MVIIEIRLPSSRSNVSLTFTVFISPELREKREAAGKLVMGTVTKIVLRFRERFWEKNR